MRVFVAVDIGEKIRGSVGKLQGKLGGAVESREGDLKWVSTDNMHLTLKFLGDVRDKEIVDVCRVVEAVALRHGRFEMSIEGVGHFGGNSARVLWVGVGDGKAELLSLQKDVEEALDEAGWPAEARQFTGHLTLCRIKNFRLGKELAQAAGEYKDYHVGVGGVDSVTVYESQLTRQGPIYTVLSKCELR